jgi:hypothetical protein
MKAGIVKYTKEQILRMEKHNSSSRQLLYLQDGWVKGRLRCPRCNGRVGGFDFVSGQKCACGLCVLPAVHLIRSKLDQH